MYHTVQWAQLAKTKTPPGIERRTTRRKQPYERKDRWREK
jgi:hypothetical protein